jgi:hypothetical protein
MKSTLASLTDARAIKCLGKGFLCLFASSKKGRSAKGENCHRSRLRNCLGREREVRARTGKRVGRSVSGSASSRSSGSRIELYRVVARFQENGVADKITKRRKCQASSTSASARGESKRTGVCGAASRTGSCRKAIRNPSVLGKCEPDQSPRRGGTASISNAGHRSVSRGRTGTVNGIGTGGNIESRRRVTFLVTHDGILDVSVGTRRRVRLSRGACLSSTRDTRINSVEDECGGEGWHYGQRKHRQDKRFFHTSTEQ